MGLVPLATFGVEPGERGGGAELEPAGVREARDIDRALEGHLCLLAAVARGAEQQLAPEAVQLGLVPALAARLDTGERRLRRGETLGERVHLETDLGLDPEVERPAHEEATFLQRREGARNPGLRAGLGTQRRVGPSQHQLGPGAERRHALLSALRRRQPGQLPHLRRVAADGVHGGGEGERHDLRLRVRERGGERQRVRHRVPGPLGVAQELAGEAQRVPAAGAGIVPGEPLRHGVVRLAAVEAKADLGVPARFLVPATHQVAHPRGVMGLKDQRFGRVRAEAGEQLLREAQDGRQVHPLLVEVPLPESGGELLLRVLGPRGEGARPGQGRLGLVGGAAGNQVGHGERVLQLGLQARALGRAGQPRRSPRSRGAGAPPPRGRRRAATPAGRRAATTGPRGRRCPPR